jgi:hypothetical protein
MNQPPPPTRLDLEAIVQRQNQVAIRSMALENVVRGLGAWLAAAMPERTAERMLEGLAKLPDMQLGDGVPPEVAENIKSMVEREQRDVVDSIRRETALRNGPRPYPADRGRGGDGA